MSQAYKKIEIVGTSPSSVTDAIQGAIDRAASTVHNLKWFEVDEIRGRIDDGKVAEYQVTLKIGFLIDGSE
ncbi:MAG: dodecin family protein [Planctomycetota bacterium]|nr:dodecin family protein [Planctomycetota bacterium]